MAAHHRGSEQRICAKDFHPSSAFILYQLPACGMSVHIEDWSFQNLPGHTQKYDLQTARVSLQSNQVHNQNAPQPPENLLDDPVTSPPSRSFKKNAKSRNMGDLSRNKVLALQAGQTSSTHIKGGRGYAHLDPQELWEQTWRQDDR